ncbi:MAG: cytochrome c [Bryobacterales bacterium]|nr:cytochrome c [Bryobacterales bacterium]
MRNSRYIWLPFVMLIALAAVSCEEAKGPSAIKTREIAYASLPLGADELPPGPGRSETVMACMSCHSPVYITSQPPFSRAVWESEVKKMIDAYGAQVRPYDQKLIADYLVSIRGLSKAKQ